jgi:hypothetical protein
MHIPAVAAQDGCDKALGLQRRAVANGRKYRFERADFVLSPRLNVLLRIASIVASVTLVSARLVCRPADYAVCLGFLLSLNLRGPLPPQDGCKSSNLLKREAPFLVVALNLAMLTIMAEADEASQN